MQDNTSDQATKVQAPEEIEIKDQETLEKALAQVTEPVKGEEEVEEPTESEPEEELEKNELVFGKYKSLEEAQKAYANIQARATKAEQQLKEIQKKIQEKSLEDVKSLDYDKQVEYLLQKTQELEEFKAKLQEEQEALTQEATHAADQEAMEEFITKNPYLKETGLDEEFRLIATHPSMQEYTFESIFEKRFKPKVEKLMGTKISVKERPLRSTNSVPENIQEKFKDVSSLSPKEYEKHRKQIFESAGIK